VVQFAGKLQFAAVSKGFQRIDVWTLTSEHVLEREMMFKCARPLILVASIFAAIGAPAEAQELKKVRVTIPVIGMNFLPLFVAADKGIFAKEGLEVEIISTSGDGPDIDALIAGSVQFTISTPNRLLTSYAQGKPLLAVMNVANRMGIDCVMNKATADRLGITEKTPLADKLKALKGLKAAGSRPGAFTYLVLVDYAKRAGLDPQRDVQLLGAGGTASMMPAIENGAIDVGCNTSPGTDLMVERGKSIMFTYNSAGADDDYNDFLFELLYARPDYAKQNPDTVRAFVRSLLEAVAYIEDTPTKDQLPQLRSRFSGVSDELLTKSLDTLKPMFPRDGKVTPASYNKAVKFLIGAGAVTEGAPWNAVATYDYLPK
jgi:NitT/TauT family transport system substrate-binding protein